MLSVVDLARRDVGHAQALDDRAEDRGDRLTLRVDTAQPDESKHTGRCQQVCTSPTRSDRSVGLAPGGQRGSWELIEQQTSLTVTAVSRQMA